MELVAIMMDNVDTARSARSECMVMARDGLIRLEDAVVVYRDMNGIQLDQSVNLTAAGALGGAWWGMLVGGIVGLALGQPAIALAGAAGGSAGGATSGWLTDGGISDEMMRESGEAIRDGKAILFLKVESGNPDKVIGKLSGFGGHVVMSSLSAELDRKINDALGQGR